MTITINGTTGLAGVAGSASTPAMQGTDTNTGVFYPAADTVAIATNGTEAMRVDSSQNVGIGTSSPNARVQIDSSSANYSANFRIRNSNFGNGVVGAISNVMTVATDMNNLAFYTASNMGVDGTSAPTNERARIDSSGNWYMNSGYGSAAVAYGCRAWVNFNGTGTVAITASGNCSSITDNGVGDYTVNFTSALVDANYNFVANGSNTTSANILCAPVLNWDNPTKTTSALRLYNPKTTTGALTDQNTISVAVFR